MILWRPYKYPIGNSSQASTRGWEERSKTGKRTGLGLGRQPQPGVSIRKRKGLHQMMQPFFWVGAPRHSVGVGNTAIFGPINFRFRTVLPTDTSRCATARAASGEWLNLYVAEHKLGSDR